MITYDVESPMRDGVVLRSTVYRPAGSGRAMDAMYFDVLRAVRRGYVVIRQDVRLAGCYDRVQVPVLHVGGCARRSGRCR